MASVTAQPSFLATRRGKLTLALLAVVAFIDFVDASIVALAERLGIRRLATTDRRRFGGIRLRRGGRLELVP